MKKQSIILLLLLLFKFSNAQVIIKSIADLPQALQMPNKPNIILILADDLSYNTLTPDNGPAFLSTPSISRIATEGIRFKNSFTTFSLCEPSRAQMLTGYYPHVSGVVCGGPNYDIPSNFSTLPQIMKANGYRTGLIGKYQVGYYATPRAGWDYWFSFSGGIASDTNAGYYNTPCNLNGVDTLISGHMSDAIANFTNQFLATTNSNQPFFLIIAEAAPHRPYEPQTIYKNLYLNQSVSVPTNFGPYSINYPSYLYPDCEITTDTTSFIHRQKHYYKLVKGTDNTAKTVFSFLTLHGLLSKSMIIFTSDNGMLFGEHHLTDKMLAYEESIRVPLYIRYPAWFNTNGATDSKHLALNLDLFTTMLDAAGAIDTFNTHGISLRYLANDSIARNLFMYEYVSVTNTSLPNIRAVRSQRYKFIKSYCSSNVEEFYDLKLDPHESINQIYNPAYLTRITSMRNSLDSIRLALNDTAYIFHKTCNLMNITPRMSMENLNQNDITLINSVPDVLNVDFKFSVPQNSVYSIYNMEGKLIKARTKFETDDLNSLSIPIDNLKPGIYILKFELDSTIKSFKFIKGFSN